MRIRSERSFLKSQCSSFSTVTKPLARFPGRECSQDTLCDSPKILSSLDLSAIRGDNVLRRANDGEGHSSDKTLGMISSLRVIILDGRGVDADAMLGDCVSELCERSHD